MGHSLLQRLVGHRVFEQSADRAPYELSVPAQYRRMIKQHCRHTGRSGGVVDTSLRPNAIYNNSTSHSSGTSPLPAATAAMVCMEGADPLSMRRRGPFQTSARLIDVCVTTMSAEFTCHHRYLPSDVNCFCRYRYNDWFSS